MLKNKQKHLSRCFGSRERTKTKVGTFFLQTFCLISKYHISLYAKYSYNYIKLFPYIKIVYNFIELLNIYSVTIIFMESSVMSQSSDTSMLTDMHSHDIMLLFRSQFCHFYLILHSQYSYNPYSSDTYLITVCLSILISQLSTLSRVMKCKCTQFL